jgi:hypothetical protein
MGQRVIFPWGDEEQGGGWGNRPQAGSSWVDTVHCKLLMIHTDSFTEVEGNQNVNLRRWILFFERGMDLIKLVAKMGVGWLSQGNGWLSREMGG